MIPTDWLTHSLSYHQSRDAIASKNMTINLRGRQLSILNYTRTWSSIKLTIQNQKATLGHENWSVFTPLHNYHCCVFYECYCIILHWKVSPWHPISLWLHPKRPASLLILTPFLIIFQLNFECPEHFSELLLLTTGWNGWN